MGHVFVDVRLTGKRSATVSMLVDTGATHTMLPADLAKRLGIVSLRRKIKVELADGTRRSMRFGAALVRLMGREAGDAVLIGPAGIEPILGVEALEALGLKVNPRSRKLEPTRARAVLLVGVRSCAEPSVVPLENDSQSFDRLLAGGSAGIVCAPRHQRVLAVERCPPAVSRREIARDRRPKTVGPIRTRRACDAGRGTRLALKMAGLTFDTGSSGNGTECGRYSTSPSRIRSRSRFRLRWWWKWWRSGSGSRLRAEILRAVRVEPPTLHLAKLAGEAVGRVPGAGAVDAIVMASAALRGDLVYTSDPDDLDRLGAACFTDVRIELA